MAYMNRFNQSDEGRRDELIRIIEHSVEKLTLQELDDVSAIYNGKAINFAHSVRYDIADNQLATIG